MKITSENIEGMDFLELYRLISVDCKLLKLNFSLYPTIHQNPNINAGDALVYSIRVVTIIEEKYLIRFSFDRRYLANQEQVVREFARDFTRISTYSVKKFEVREDEFLFDLLIDQNEPYLFLFARVFSRDTATTKGQFDYKSFTELKHVMWDPDTMMLELITLYHNTSLQRKFNNYANWTFIPTFEAYGFFYRLEGSDTNVVKVLISHQIDEITKVYGCLSNFGVEVINHHQVGVITINKDQGKDIGQEFALCVKIAQDYYCQSAPITTR